MSLAVYGATLAGGSTARAQLRDDAAEYIRELIISGQAAPGALLRLGSLAEQIDASITPVREALLLLAQDGWVLQEPNRGFRVAPIARDDVEDSYLVQSFVAGELAARAAEQPTPAAIAELRRLDAEVDGLDGGHDYQRVEDLNYQLHGVIYGLADSQRLVWFVRTASRFVPRRFWATIPGWLAHNRTQHGPVIDAVEAGDADRARGLMAAHIHAAGALLVAHLDAISFWDEVSTR